MVEGRTRAEVLGERNSGLREDFTWVSLNSVVIRMIGGGVTQIIPRVGGRVVLEVIAVFPGTQFLLLPGCGKGFAATNLYS